MGELAKELMQLSFNVPALLGGLDPVVKSVGSSFFAMDIVYKFLFPSTSYPACILFLGKQK